MIEVYLRETILKPLNVNLYISLVGAETELNRAYEHGGQVIREAGGVLFWHKGGKFFIRERCGESNFKIFFDHGEVILRK